MIAKKRSKKKIPSLPVVLLAITVCASSVAVVTFCLTHSLGPLEESNPISQALASSSMQSNSVPLDLDQIYPREEPIPNPPPPDGHDTFSACLLVMDDNHRLTEWLAYHYHVLPLRYIVVTADPRSKTSPNSILNQWRRRGVYIEQWNDRDFWKKELKLAPIPDDAPLQTKRDRHRGRQKYFYRKCLIHMQKHNRTWVSLHDTDEYLVYNHAGGANYEAWEHNMSSQHARSSFRRHKRIKPSQTPPTTAQEGAMIQYIRQEQSAGLEYYQSPCIGIPRLQFGAVESTPEQVAHNVPTPAPSRRQQREPVTTTGHTPLAQTRTPQRLSQKRARQGPHGCFQSRRNQITAIHEPPPAHQIHLYSSMAQ